MGDENRIATIAIYLRHGVQQSSAFKYLATVENGYGMPASAFHYTAGVRYDADTALIGSLVETASSGAGEFGQTLSSAESHRCCTIETHIELSAVKQTPSTK